MTARHGVYLWEPYTTGETVTVVVSETGQPPVEVGVERTWGEFRGEPFVDYWTILCDAAEAAGVTLWPLRVRAEVDGDGYTFVLMGGNPTWAKDDSW